MRRLKTCLKSLLCLVLGAILAEGFLRMLIPVEAQFETWFTPGIEQWDPEFGAVYRPNWSGTMRHVDGVYRGVPLNLDEHGFRLPVRSGPAHEAKRVLLIGGRSAMMSYGLPDAEAIPQQIVDAAGIPLEVHCIAWAGGNLLRSWNLYRRHLADENWDLVIVSHINPYLPSYADSASFDRLPDPPSREWIFRYMDGIQLWRDGLFQRTGRAAFQSYLGYGLIRLADSAVKRIAEMSRENGTPTETVALREQHPPAEGLADYRNFLLHMKSHFSSRGTPVLLHFPPRPYGEPDHHAPYRDTLSKEFDILDLHRELHPQLEPTSFIANGHYGRELAARIGQKLAAAISVRIQPDKS